MRSRLLILIALLVATWSSSVLADLVDEELDPSTSPKPSADVTAPVKPVPPDSPPKNGTEVGGEKPGSKTPTIKPGKTKTTKKLAPSTTKTKRKEQEKKQPVKYQSNGLSGLRDKGTIELLDDVVVSQGTLKLEANRAKILFDETTDEVKTVTANGQIKMFRYDKDSGEQIKAFGDKLIFLNDQRKIILEGNARLFRGPNLMRGNRLIYELDTGWIRAEKVEGELHPEKGE